jgi:hypothetical protein
VKNFPHQFNDPAKLIGSLQAIVDLEASGADAFEDDTLGYELARRQIYRFRALDYESPGVNERVIARIEGELAKALGSQGARTAARDVRRSLILLGFVTDELELTNLGGELLEAPPGSDQEQQLWQSALISARLEDPGGNVSHPVRHLLALARNQPFAGRDGTELALEARDDTEAEYERIQALAQLLPIDRAQQLTAGGATSNKIENARKILPALALHAGLLTSDPQGRLRLTEAGRALLEGAWELGPMGPPAGGENADLAARFRPSRAPRRVNANTAARDRTFGDRRALTPEEQSEAARLLAERTDRHQGLVQRLAGLSGAADLYEDTASFDLLMVPADGALVLWEAKTINTYDAVSQIRSAVGQLFFYRHFAVAARWPGREVSLAIVVDRAISQDLVDFLTAMGIGALLLTAELVALNELGNGILELLDQLQAH